MHQMGSCAHVQVVDNYLYSEQGFALPPSGSSNIPHGATVDHPGVWENASYAYLHQVLVTKRGIPATLAVVYAQVMQRLLQLGAVNFAVRMECSDFSR